MAAVMGIGVGLLLSQNSQHGAESLVSSVPGTSSSDARVQKTSKGLFELPQVNLVPRLSRRKNILLMGVDSNGRNAKRFEHTRSDTMILANLDPVEGKVGLLSIPRDSRVRISGQESLDKINSAHALGGPELAVKTVEDDFGITIDNYMVIDTQGLKNVFEMIGPVEVLVEKRMRYRDRASGLTIDLEPGKQMLDAGQVEQYLRFRHDAKGDIGRVERQQWFLRQALRKMREPSFLLKLPKVLEFTNEYVVTDLSVGDLTELFGFAKDLKAHQVETAMLPGEARMISGGSYWVPDPEATAVVINRLTGCSPSVYHIANATRRGGIGEEDDDGTLSYASFGLSDNDQEDSLERASRPMSVSIKYPKGQEETAKDFAIALEKQGYSVRSRVRINQSDCQHETITLSSFRADRSTVDELKKHFPDLKSWAIVMNPTNHTRIDLTLNLSPDTIPLLPPTTVQADFDLSDIINGEVKAGKLRKPFLSSPRS